MNRIEIPGRSIVVEFPEHWNEMNAEQLAFCLKQAVFASLKVITPDEARMRCFFHLAQIERDWKTVAWEKIQSAERVREKNANIFLISERLMGFLFRETEKGIEVNYDTIMNHFPVIRVNKILLHGPSHLLADLTFGEFRAAVEEMQEYFSGKDPENLSRMIACLYRPERRELATAREAENWDGRIREPFNRAKLDQHAELTAKLGVIHRTAILLWFAYTIDYIQKQDLILGGREVNFSLLFGGSGGESGGGTGSGWTGVLYSISEKGIFGNAEATDRAGLFDVMLYMFDKDQENRKIKAKMKK